MTLEEKVDRILAVVTSIESHLFRPIQVSAGGGRFISGKFIPPADLGPAIAALSEEAREYMYSRLNGRDPSPKDIAEAADWDERRKIA